MSSDSLGFSRPSLPRAGHLTVEYILPHHPFRRVLAFTGRTIHDVVNDPIVKREVLGYYKLYRNIRRVSDVGDLERQWNPLGRRVS